MPTRDQMLTALRFNEAINARDPNALVALVTEDHVFVDTAGNETRGRDAVRAAWSGFFSAFPDYQNLIDSAYVRGDRVLLVGRSTCSEPALDGPAIWMALVRDDRVAQWQVYEDDPAVRRRWQLDAPGGDRFER